MGLLDMMFTAQLKCLRLKVDLRQYVNQLRKLQNKILEVSFQQFRVKSFLIEIITISAVRFELKQLHYTMDKR